MTPYTQPTNPIRLLEEISMSALPALRTVYHDGWVLRLSQGFTRRANSVNPTYESLGDLHEKIKFCEQLFTASQLPTTFKLTPMSYPKELDKVLEQHAYREETGASVQTCSLDTLETPANDGLRANLNASLAEEWLMAYFRLNGAQEKFIPVMRQMLSSVVPACCFAALVQGEAIVALGLGVVDRGYVGLFDIVTDEAYRQRGFGVQLMLNLLNWGKENGASQAYLQVRPDNQPALRLYEKLGFRELYQYWYRTK